MTDVNTGQPHPSYLQAQFLGVPVATPTPTSAQIGSGSVQESKPSTSKKENGPSDLAAITVSSRIAPFWKDMAKLWFTHFESIMAPQKLGNDAKFDLVISKLGKEELNTVADLLETASGKDYAALKDRLITVHQESADLQFDRLVKEMDLGSQKPSQLYRRMAEAARNASVAETTLKRLWLQRLPAAVRAILTVNEDAQLDNLVTMADKIMESMGQGVIATIATPPTPSPAVSNADFIYEFRNMALEVKQLRSEVNELRSRPTGRASYNSSRSRSRSRSRGQNRNPNWLCKYHYKFKDNARKCFQPCSWGSSSSSSSNSISRQAQRRRQRMRGSHRRETERGAPWSGWGVLHTVG